MLRFGHRNLRMKRTRVRALRERVRAKSRIVIPQVSACGHLRKLADYSRQSLGRLLPSLRFMVSQPGGWVGLHPCASHSAFQAVATFCQTADVDVLAGTPC